MPQSKTKSTKGIQLPREESVFLLVVTVVTKVVIRFDRPMAINSFS